MEWEGEHEPPQLQLPTLHPFVVHRRLPQTLASRHGHRPPHLRRTAQGARPLRLRSQARPPRRQACVRDGEEEPPRRSLRHPPQPLRAREAPDPRPEVVFLALLSAALNSCASLSFFGLTVVC